MLIEAVQHQQMHIFPLAYQHIDAARILTSPPALPAAARAAYFASPVIQTICQEARSLTSGQVALFPRYRTSYLASTHINCHPAPLMRLLQAHYALQKQEGCAISPLVSADPQRPLKSQLGQI